MAVRREGTTGGASVRAVFLAMLALAIQSSYGRSDSGFEQYSCAHASRARRGGGWRYGGRGRRAEHRFVRYSWRCWLSRSRAATAVLTADSSSTRAHTRRERGGEGDGGTEGGDDGRSIGSCGILGDAGSRDPEQLRPF